MEDFAANALDLAFKGPCPSGSSASVTVRLTLHDPNDGSALARPPSAVNNVPSTVQCGSAPVSLAATVGDIDGDLAEVRWLLDGVLLDTSVTSIPFTEAHTVTVRARDARGATTSDSKVVSCAP